MTTSGSHMTLDDLATAQNDEFLSAAIGSLEETSGDATETSIETDTEDHTPTLPPPPAPTHGGLIVGNIVRLKSGGPEMVVVELLDPNTRPASRADEVECTWFTFHGNTRPESSAFPAAALALSDGIEPRTSKTADASPTDLPELPRIKIPMPSLSPARAGIKGKRKPGRLPRRTEADIRESVARIVAYLKKHPEGRRAEHIRVDLGFDVREMAKVLTTGVKDRSFKVAGRKRASTYSLPATRKSR